jgi:prepilin-type N-terminal cleavage/methylation domain-containing protein
MKLKNTKGFTLIELLIVIAIIGVLAAVVLGVVNPARQRQRAQDGTLISTISKLGAVVETFYGVKGRYPNTHGSGYTEPAGAVFPDLQCTTTDGQEQECEFIAELEAGSNPDVITVGTDANYTSLYFSLPGITTGLTNRIYYRGAAAYFGCVAARSNENVREYIVKAQGRPVQRCSLNATSPSNSEPYACLVHVQNSSYTSYGTCTNVSQ